METEKDKIVEIRSKNMLEKAYMREVVWRPIIMLPWESNIMKWQMITTKSEPILIGLLWSGIDYALMRFERGWRSWRNRKVMLLVVREWFSLGACRTYYYDTWSNEYFLYCKCFCLFDNFDEAILVDREWLLYMNLTPRGWGLTKEHTFVKNNRLEGAVILRCQNWTKTFVLWSYEYMDH